MRNIQLELPFPDQRGAKAQRILDRFKGERLLSFWGQIRGMDSTGMVVIASDSGEAKSMYFQRAKAGYNLVKFINIKITRNELDEWAGFLGKGIYTREEVTERVKKHVQQHRKDEESHDHPEMPLPL